MNERRILFGPGRVRVSGPRNPVIVARPPSQGHGQGRGGSSGGGQGKGRGRGQGLASVLPAFIAASATSHGSPQPAPPAVPAALVLLSSTTLAANGTFDVQNIDQTYSDLLLVVIARGTANDPNDVMILRLNGDSGLNYNAIWLTGEGATAASASSQGASNIRAAQAMPAASATANRFGLYEITIGGYASTTWHKQVITRGGSGNDNTAAQQWSEANGGVWMNTAAVTRITLQGSISPNLATGSQLRIYGRS